MENIEHLLGKVHQGDCLPFMRALPDKCVSTIITSPPYNTNMRYSLGGGWNKMKQCANGGNKYLNNMDCLSLDEYFNLCDSIIGEGIRICKDNVFFNIQMITGNKIPMMRLLGKYAEKLKEIIIWNKCYAEPSIADGVLNSQFEFIYVFSDNAILRRFDKATFAKGTVSNVWDIPKNTETIAGHSALMPIKIPYKILNSFTQKDDIIFEPFVGCGTTPTACESLGYKWFGCEIDPTYCKIAEERIQAERAQGKLF